MWRFGALTMIESHRAGRCEATVYVNTELDERLLPPGARGLAKITGYWPYDPDKARAYYEAQVQ
jgi:hypothetical protein